MVRKLRLLLRFCLALVLVLNANFSVEASSAVLRVEDIEGSVGHTLEVSVIIENPSGITAGEFVLAYDPEVVEPKDISRGDLNKVTDGYLFISNPEYSEDSIKLAWVGLKEANSDGTVSIITFLLKEEGQSELKILNPMLTDGEATEISIEVVNGSIATVSEGSGKGEAAAPGEEGPSSNILFWGLPIIILAAMAGFFYFYKKRQNKENLSE